MGLATFVATISTTITMNNCLHRFSAKWDGDNKSNDWCYKSQEHEQEQPSDCSGDLFGSLLELTRGGRVVILVACDSQSGQGRVCECTDMMGLVESIMNRIWMNDTTGTSLGRVCRFRDRVSILAIGAT